MQKRIRKIIKNVQGQKVNMSDKKDSIFKSKSDAGKGDKPRNISSKYFENFDKIAWKNKTKKNYGDESKD